MDEWLSGRHLIDAVLLVTVIEFLALALYRRRTGKGLQLGDIAANLLAGLCLMLAVRAAVSGAAIAWVALALLAAGVAHGVDLMHRWRR